MSLLETAKKLHLEDAHILAGELKKNDGSWVRATLDLDQYLSNIEGLFLWRAGNYSATTRNAQIQIGHDDVYILGDLLKTGGEWRNLQGLRISDYIRNDNGRFAVN